MLLVQWFACAVGLLISSPVAIAFSNDRNDNLAAYWGQDSAGHQQRLSFYCNDDTINAIPLAFLYIFFGKGGEPVVDFSNICSQGSGDFSGTSLADCSFMAADIQKCQANGKIVTLSLGGATADVGFSSASQASNFAVTIWDMFLGGSGDTRPFGSAVLDGVDLDIENGSAAHYDTFVNTLRSLAKNAKKRYYVTAAPQCPFPDTKVGDALNNAYFDAVYVQFYNNYCAVSLPSDFNFATWDTWAKTKSANKNIKVYIGAPGSADSASWGYVASQTLISMAKQAQKKYSSFGGVMLWDADSAYTNNQYHVTVKNAIKSGSSGTSPNSANPTPDTTFTIPASTGTQKKTTATTTADTDDTTATPLPDPRHSGRVRPRPSDLGMREVAPTALAVGHPTPRRNSRLFIP